MTAANGHAARSRGGTVWITGLPAAGKTTLSTALQQVLADEGLRVYGLDGDELRRSLCSDLGFDRLSRSENVRRVAYIARLLADAGSIVLVSLVSPYADDRKRARALHAEVGLPFVEVFVDTPIEVCRQRDPKGLYARADCGQLQGMTGVDDPYEPPAQPDLHLPPMPLERCIEATLEVLALSGVLGAAHGLASRRRNGVPPQPKAAI